MVKKTIMVVDDEPMIVKVLQDVFKEEGYKVITALSGQECIEKLKKTSVDLILLDIMMPGMDGWDTCSKIKGDKKTEKIPIVFLTAKTDPVSMSMGGLASSDYITKPFEMKDLKKRVDSIIKSKSTK